MKALTVAVESKGDNLQPSSRQRASEGGRSQLRGPLWRPSYVAAGISCEWIDFRTPRPF
jgi:hypothetical protein